MCFSPAYRLEWTVRLLPPLAADLVVTIRPITQHVVRRRAGELQRFRGCSSGGATDRRARHLNVGVLLAYSLVGTSCADG